MMPQKLTMPEMMAWRMPPMPEMTAMMQLPIVRNMLVICRETSQTGTFFEKRDSDCSENLRKRRRRP